MKTNNDLEHFRSLSYTTTLVRDEEGDFVARIQELPGCSAHGASREEALANLDDAFNLWVEDALEAGDPVPVPESESLPSGKWLQRTPRSLHKKLIELAKREATSLNQLVTAILGEAVGRKTYRASDEVIGEIKAAHEDVKPNNFISYYYSKALQKQSAWIVNHSSGPIPIGNLRCSVDAVAQHIVGKRQDSPFELTYEDQEKSEEKRHHYTTYGKC